MAQTKIFNASEFVRLSVEAALERVEKKYGLKGAVAPVPPLSGHREGNGTTEGPDEGPAGLEEF